MTDLDTLDASDFSDTEEKPVEKKSKEVLPELNKYGKPKRKMTEKQLAVLAAARLKGAAKRAENAAIRRKEKELNVENHLIKKLELQKRIKQHERRKKRLQEVSDSEEEAELEPTPVPRPRKKVPVQYENIAEVEKEQKKELDLLKEQLEKIQTELKDVKIEQKKPKRRVVKTIIESDLEDEPDDEPVSKPKPKTSNKNGRVGDMNPTEVIQLSRHNSNTSVTSDTSQVSRTSVRRPVMDTPSARDNGAFNPIKYHGGFVEPSEAEVDNELKKQLRKLFPNYK